ncbi:MAG: PqqD family protein, partial [Dehalococcoidia bacterium]|nr:PqqD family protein [Dehalococcoidia bacterium]
ILDLDSGVYFSSNEVGAEIWKAIEHGHGIDAIEQRLAEAYDVSPGQLRADIEGFVARLLERGLVVAA